MQNPKVKYARRHYEMALDLFDKEQFVRALEQIRKAIANTPDNPDYHSTMGIFYHKMNDLAQAIDAYRKAIEIKPNHTFAHFNLGLILMKLGRPTEAIKEWEAVLQEEPDGIDTLFNIAVALSEIGRVKESIPFYTKVLSLNPEHVQAHQNLGIIHRDQQEFAKARQHLLRLQKLDSTYAEVVEAELRKCAEQEFLCSVTPKIEQDLAVINSDSSFFAPETQALAALLRTEWQIALNLAEQVLRNDPKNFMARVIQGQAMVGLSRIDEALALFTQLADECPENPDSFFHLGNIHLNCDRLEQALSCFERVQRLDAAFPSIGENIKHLRSKLSPPENTTSR